LADGKSLVDTTIDPASWRVIRLRWEDPEGWVEADLLRGPDWFSQLGATQVGDAIELNMPEMGCEGQASILAIEPCPELELGSGRVVTGLFRHSAGQVYDLSLEGSSEPIGITALHPVWSVDARAWISASELVAGARLTGLSGEAILRTMLPRDIEPVYNIEVDADHCYRVGEQGLLVHNDSADDCSCKQRVEAIRKDGKVASDVILKDEFKLTSHDLWTQACRIYDQITMARAADANQQTRDNAAAHTVAVALICHTEGEKKGHFEIWSTNSFRDSHSTGITPSVGIWLTPLPYPPMLPPPGRHAERRILREAGKVKAIVIGIAASREICPTCEDRLDNIDLLSPTARHGGRTVFEAMVTCMGKTTRTPT
jgi:hypothetical protein